MKLRYSPTSPFARKVLVVAQETGSQNRLELIKTATLVPDAQLTRDNPLQKIPALLPWKAMLPALVNGSISAHSPSPSCWII